jgi:hypothetical protein
METNGNSWKNKNGTGEKDCKCGSWKNHWVNFSGEAWPDLCSVVGCEEKPTLGAHVINPNVSGEKIVPMCDSCNKKNISFALKSIVVVSANTAETCESNDQALNNAFSERQMRWFR